MNIAEAVSRITDLTARACAAALGDLMGAPGTCADITAGETTDPWAAVAFPSLALEVEFVEGIGGRCTVLLTLEQGRALAAGTMGLAEAEIEGDLNEIELSALAEAADRMVGAVATAIGEVLGTPTDAAAPVLTVLADREAAEKLGAAAFTGSFTVTAGPLSAAFSMLFPGDFAATLETALTSAETTGAVEGGEQAAKLALIDEYTRAAVERAARITADASAEVLTALLGTKTTAMAPDVEANPVDPLGGLSYPLVTVEVSYVSGVNGANLFALTPQQAASLAGAMMGGDEPASDELSDIELSAVSEAMNQMMGAATSVLADGVGLEIEVAPPMCQVIATVEDARRIFERPAFAARFQITSDRLTADVVQLVSADFALHLQDAFAAADTARGVGAPGGPARSAAAATNAAAATTTTSALSMDTFHTVNVRVSAELGRTRIGVAEAMNLPPGAIVELDRLPSDPIDILVNGRPFAQARLVLVDGEYAAQIVSLSPAA